MKLFAMLFVTFAVAGAMACPNLDGTYQCEKNPEDANDTGIVTVQAVQKDGATVYVFTDKDDAANPYTMPADGKLYQEGTETYQGSCVDNKLQAIITGVDETVGAYTINMTYGLDNATHLVNEGTVAFKYQGNDYNQPFNSVCTRL